MARSASLVSIINWNNTVATNRCLSQIAKLPKDSQPDVVVTDNHSAQGFNLEPELQKSLRSLKIVRNLSNLGFAGGHNPNIQAAKEKGYDYIILLNNDTELIDQDVFSKLTDALEADPKALGATPTILSRTNPDIIWYGGGKLSLKTSHTSHLRVGEIDGRRPEHEPQKTGFLTGCCLAISLKRVVLDQLLLSEDYFVYWEDTDWCARVSTAGFSLIYVPGAKLLHHVSDSLGVRSPSYIYYNIRNHFLFVHRNCPMVYRPLCWLQVLAIITKYKINILLRYKNTRLKTLIALWQGWFDGIRDKTGPVRRAL